MRNLSESAPPNYLILNCNTGNFSEFLLQSSGLLFFGACKNIEPYLEGHRITIQIGNPHTFNFNNVKGSLMYGENIWSSLSDGHQVDINTINAIRAGSWETFTIIINPSRPEQMRYLTLHLKAESVEATR